MSNTLPRKNNESLTDWTLRFLVDAQMRRSTCDGCGGSGLVPANSGSDVADFKCGECNGKGVRP